jgi:hypothetical protein
MSNTILVAIVVAGLLVVWFIWSISWTSRQSLVGTWVAPLPDGSHVTLQFEGVQAGGLYKQLTKQEGKEIREFGHWTIKLTRLQMIMMATDIKKHPRFGLDSEYWVTFNNHRQMTIKGPERPKWTLQRAPEGVRLDFDESKVAA